VDKFDVLKYGYSIKGGLSEKQQRQRNKALVSLLYLSARRVSEIVGRSYKGDVYDGVIVKNFRFGKLEGVDVLIMNCRILKKWKQKVDTARGVYADVIMDIADDPFISHVLDWLDHQKADGTDVKYMPISRSRVYQILQKLDPRIVGPHWFRHQRLSHLAEYLNPYQLKERIGFWEKIDPAVAYVHGRVSQYLEAIKNARK